MKLTNKMAMPQPLFDAIKNDGYTKGDADLSVTQLIAPPRVIELTRKHWDELEEDASDRVFSMFGQLMHLLLERSSTTGIAERRLSIEVDGLKISGGMDAYYPETGLLQDYKVSTLYKFRDGSAPKEFIEQLNVYAELLRQNGDKVKRLEIVGILRDWSKGAALREPGIPQQGFVVVDIPLWPQKVALEFIKDRIALHKQARVKLPMCNSNERWARHDVWAVMKPGRKSAVTLYETEAEALFHLQRDSALYIQYRPGESIRCAQYCSVAKHCTQAQQLLGKKQSA